LKYNKFFIQSKINTFCHFHKHFVLQERFYQYVETIREE